MQVLVDHVTLERVLVDGDDLAARRPPPRRIPGRAPAHEQDEIGVGDRLVVAHPEIERVIGGKVGVGVGSSVDRRDGEKIGELSQRRKRFGVASGGLRHDHRALGIAQQLGDRLDVLVPRLHGRRRRHLAHRGGRRPVVQHVLQRDVEIDRPLGHALRHFAGADHALIKRMGAGDRACPFGDRLDEALDAADGEAAIPLLLDVEVGVFAERLGFTRHDDHGHFVLHGTVHAHAPLQHADAGMQQDRLRAAGDQRVAGRHVDGERLVPGLHESRAGLVVELLARQGLPDRRPFRARRGHDVVDLELAKRLEDRLAPVEIVLHLVLAPWIAGAYQHRIRPSASTGEGVACPSRAQAQAQDVD